MEHLVRVPTPPRGEYDSDYGDEALNWSLEDVESIALTFHRPVAEPFELTSPPLK